MEKSIRRSSSKRQEPQDEATRARSLALRLLARREHSRMELGLKLRQRHIEQAVIEEVLDEYEDNDWLSDERFADVYSRQRMDLGYGPLRIEAELQQRGVRNVPEELRSVTDVEWSERATRIREKRFGLQDLSEDWEEKGRQARFLARRGFSQDHIEAALEARAAEK